jgi:1-acyl-sn-glycerol-3-phosphate acyltransferase
MLRAAFVLVVSSLLIILVGAPALVYAAISGDTDTLYRVGRFCAALVLRLAGIRLEVRGAEKIPSGRAVVFMPNHQSNADGPAILVCLPPVLVLAKREFFRVPVLGWAMRLRGFIPVDRGNRERAIQAVDEAAEALRAGRSFLVFPEGTRSLDGRLQPFKKGGFIMALKARVPIVPISISGGRRIMRKGEHAIHPGRIWITFHDPVATEGRQPEERGRLMEAVRRAMLSGLTAEEWPLEEQASQRES